MHTPVTEVNVSVNDSIESSATKHMDSFIQNTTRSQNGINILCNGTVKINLVSPLQLDIRT